MNINQIKDFVEKKNRVPVLYRTDKYKAIELMEFINVNSIIINNPDIFVIKNWIDKSYSEKYSVVKSVYNTGDVESTFDLSVNDGHSYIANGIICHNTINLPENVTEEEVSKIYEAAWEYGVKGCTVYRKNCRTGVLIEKKEELPTDIIVQTTAPKRPKSLPADAYVLNIKGESYYAVVSLLGGRPYEIFTGENSQGIISKSNIHGSVVKSGRGNYVFIDEHNVERHLTNGHNDDNVDALCRIISMSLRHGCAIDFIVHQLEKTRGDLFTFSKVIARTLKRYVKDGTVVYGETCDTCGSSKIERQDGCQICKNCGASKCA